MSTKIKKQLTIRKKTKIRDQNKEKNMLKHFGSIEKTDSKKFCEKCHNKIHDQNESMMIIERYNYVTIGTKCWRCRFDEIRKEMQ